MKAMIEISRHTAQSIWKNGDAELYELLDDGAESLLLGCDDFNNAVSNGGRFGIEGELFGEPYPDEPVDGAAINGKEVDLAEEITESILPLLSNSPVYQHDGGNDPDGKILTEEAQCIFNAVLEILDGDSKGVM